NRSEPTCMRDRAAAPATPAAPLSAVLREIFCSDIFSVSTTIISLLLHHGGLYRDRTWPGMALCPNHSARHTSRWDECRYPSRPCFFPPFSVMALVPEFAASRQLHLTGVDHLLQWPARLLHGQLDDGAPAR